MTRYHYFNEMYPEISKQLSEGQQETFDIIWNAFARATWLNKFFDFKIDAVNKVTVPKSNGTDNDTPFRSDEITIE